MDTPTPGTPDASPNHNPLIPRDQDEKAALTLRLVEGWGANPQLLLIWITQAEFKTKVDAFVAALKLKNQTAAKRPQITQSLDEIDAKITAGLGYVKGYLDEKFTKQKAKAYYEEFGIKFYDDQYQLPRKQTERATALEDLVTALATYGLSGRDYGDAYWKPLRDDYKAANKNATTSSQTVSTQVGTKNEALDDVEEVLQALPLLVAANYRDEDARRAKLRELGYLKEYN